MNASNTAAVTIPATGLPLLNLVGDAAPEGACCSGSSCGGAAE